MTIRIVRLGSPRRKNEGIRIGTVRRPPRGVPKAEFSTGDWYDVWFPTLAPSVATMKLGQAATTPSEWNSFFREFRSEMSQPAAKHALRLLATLSHSNHFSVGCYCVDENRCHRSVLRALLVKEGADVLSE